MQLPDWIMRPPKLIWHHSPKCHHCYGSSFIAFAIATSASSTTLLLQMFNSSRVTTRADNQLLHNVGIISVLLFITCPVASNQSYDWCYACWSSFSTSPCPSARPLSVQYFSSIVRARLFIMFSGVLSSFSLEYPFATLSNKILTRLPSKEHLGWQ